MYVFVCLFFVWHTSSRMQHFSTRISILNFKICLFKSLVCEIIHSQRAFLCQQSFYCPSIIARYALCQILFCGWLWWWVALFAVAEINIPAASPPPSCLCGLIECFLKVFRRGIAFIFFFAKGPLCTAPTPVLLSLAPCGTRMESRPPLRIKKHHRRALRFFVRVKKRGTKEDNVRDLHYFTFRQKWLERWLNR